ncbi:putative ribosomally synthesized peptide with SipW-like signal peptide [Melghiribacillus thermohalophilus]|uniref:Putative ribosomally synthesized peptide with SipW-like signal peptide n=1 Tax=Melghiribacillus thermohalophilus TaxID=1324956 RepID=A0A4R3NDE5_9BACI|nr:TasA family protein [Melghiribacillus thermohalophilus]TCT26500.1 putative ribosomally synthesized peptide with SipW-like signal peptide [Melghiribacillus thermohalophilus]
MNLKKKLGMAIAGTALGASLVVGGTTALFTDTATNEGNTFTAGTVDIVDVTEGAVFSASQFVDNLAPGDSETATLTIRNEGSLDAWVEVYDATTSGDLFEGDYPVELTFDDSAVLVPAGGETTVEVSYHFPIEAGNEYQGATGNVDFQIRAVQSRNNSVDHDGGGTYDGPANWN